ncbi:MAG: hypothetical protein AB1486_07530 [Planctomycetota bacterium]
MTQEHDGLLESAEMAPPRESPFCRGCGGKLPALERALSFCPFCGVKVPREPPLAQFCPTCGKPRGEKERPRERHGPWRSQPQRAVFAQALYPSGVPAEGVRSEILAACLSICPGLGQVYNGQFFRGILFFLGTVTLIWGGIGFLIWGWSVWHAYHTARERRLRADLDWKPQDRAPPLRTWSPPIVPRPAVHVRL